MAAVLASIFQKYGHIAGLKNQCSSQLKRALTKAAGSEAYLRHFLT